MHVTATLPGALPAVLQPLLHPPVMLGPLCTPVVTPPLPVIGMASLSAPDTLTHALPSTTVAPAQAPLLPTQAPLLVPTVTPITLPVSLPVQVPLLQLPALLHLPCAFTLAMLALPATTVAPLLWPLLKPDHKLFCMQQGGPVLAVMHITVLLPPARIPSIQLPPMPDGQTPMPDVKSLDTPRGGSVLMFTVAHVMSSLLSSSALPAPPLPLCPPVLPGPQCISA
ncbi:hypothetical protein AX14_011923, partial [Amanita brunnescens Koide BX004]